MNSYEIGVIGEKASVEYLKKNKYKIVTTNFKTTFGEIDIIATKGKEIVFFEVKTRSSTSFGLPIEFVNSEKLRKITQTIRFFMNYYKVTLQPRIDVIEVYAKLFENKYEVERIVHHKSVFME